MWRKRVGPWAVLVVGAVVAALGTVVPAGAADITPGLVEAREAAAAAAQRIADAETRIGELDLEVELLEARVVAAEGSLDDLSARITELAVARYTRSGSGAGSSFLLAGDPNEQAKADALARIVNRDDVDAVDQYRALREDLEVDQAHLAELRAEQDVALIDLADHAAAIGADLSALEELEAARLEEERLRREAERRRQEEEARRQRVAAAAAAAAAGPSSNTAIEPAQPVIVNSDWFCPVAGPHSFIDSWGYPRSGGRRHKGVDIMAAKGTPVVAPVSGNVTHRSNRVGGKSFYLTGDDGDSYYGTHLDDYGESGWVAAGTVIGYVGATGNAAGGSPHLHFEIKPGGGSSVNPYPTTSQYCAGAA